MKRISIFCLAMILFFPAYLQADDKPELIIYQTPLQFTLSPSCKDAEKLSFLLFSTGTEKNDIEIEKPVIISIKPEEREYLSSPSEAIQFEFENGQTVTSGGLKIVAKIDVTKFLQPGKYQVLIEFNGKAGGKPVNAYKPNPTLTIIHPEASFDLAEFKDCTLKLTRSIYLGPASGNFQFSLFDPTRKSSIRNLKAFSAGVWDNNKNPATEKIPAPGEVSVKPELTECLPAGDKLTLKLTLSGFEKTGVFNTKILLSSPSFKESLQSIDLKIAVTDFWLWPLVSIVAGVLVGLAMTYITKRLKPTQEILLRTTKLRGLLTREFPRTQDPEKIQKLNGIQKDIDDAEGKTRVQDFTGAGTLINNAEKSWREFENAKLLDLVKTGNSVRALRASIREYEKKFQNGDGVDQGDIQGLNELESKLDGVESQLALGELDQASKMLKGYQDSFDKLRKNIISTKIQYLKGQIPKLPAGTDKIKLQNEATAIEDFIKDDKLDQARKNLDRLEKEIRAAQQGRKTILIEDEDQPITLKVDPKFPSSDETIKFSLTGKLPPHDEVQWDFNDGNPYAFGEKTFHRYARSKVYDVRVTLLKNKQPVKFYQWKVGVLPGEAEKSEEKIRGILNSMDYLFFLIALLVATITGFLSLYVGQIFGSVSNYLGAFLWGLGVDGALKGFKAIYNQITQ